MPHALLASKEYVSLGEQYSWNRTYKYKGVRYIGNSAVGGKNNYGYEIPLSNLIEFSSKGKPFIRRTFDENKEEIIRIIKGEIEDGNSK